MTKSKYEDVFKKSDILKAAAGMYVIPFDIIEKRLGEEYAQFMDWMRGQTCVEEGAYLCDVKNYFYRRDQGKLNSLPHGY